MFKALVDSVKRERTRYFKLKSLLETLFPYDEAWFYKHVVNLLTSHNLDLVRTHSLWQKVTSSSSLSSFYRWLKEYALLSPLDRLVLTAWINSVDKNFAARSPRRFKALGDRLFARFKEHFPTLTQDQFVYALPSFIKSQAEKAQERQWAAFFEQPKQLLAPLGWQDWCEFVKKNYGSFSSYFCTSRKHRQKLREDHQTAEAVFHLRSLALRLGRIDLFDKLGREVFSDSLSQIINELEEECRKRKLTSQVLS